jgi:uncharacterized protein DUF3617
MKWNKGCAIFPAILLFAPAPTFAAGLTPGQYEYTIQMTMTGAPALPPQTMQRCLTASDVAGNKSYEMPRDRNSDCQTRDVSESGGKFSYKVSCTKPQKLDGTAKGTVTSTSMTMEMNMTMADAPGPMTQTITARRIGDCKQ